MSTHAVINPASIRPKRVKGEGPATYVRRVKYMQVHYQLSAYRASCALSGDAPREGVRHG